MPPIWCRLKGDCFLGPESAGSQQEIMGQNLPPSVTPITPPFGASRHIEVVEFTQ